MKISDRLSEVIFEIFNKYSDDAVAEEKARNFIDSVGLDINSLSDEDGSDDPDSAMIHMAICGNHDRVLSFLIKIGADIEVKTNRNESPLNIAAAYNNVFATQLLLNNGADIESVDGDGRTPLLSACDNCALDTIQLLVDRGVDVNVCDISGEIPLHCAARIGNIDMVKLLVENGAIISKKNNTDRTPIDLAQKRINPNLPDGTDDYAAIVTYLESRIHPGALLNDEKI
jgi:ankyrin repeat protein